MLQKLYSLLRTLYNLHDLPVSVEPFFINDIPRSYSGIQRTGNRMPTREAVFSVTHGNDVEIGIYLHPSIRKRLSRGEIRFDDLACAAEGISHFLYLADRGLQRRCCSQLELELQGEIDKFLLLHLMSLELHGRVCPNLFARQFEHVTYDDRLSREERERYETANHFAAKYCYELRNRCFFPYRPQVLVEEVRPFFEEDLRGKLKNLIP